MFIAIIDDHEIVREGIAALLATKLQDTTVRHACSVEELVAQYPYEPFSLILLDYYIPGTKAESNIKLAKENYKSASVIFISSDESDDVANHSYELGADGFVVKSANTELLTAVILLIKNTNKPYFPNRLKNINPLHKSLSKSQLKCIELLLLDYKYKRISEELGITVGTVKQHITVAYSKLGVKSKKELLKIYKK